MPPLATLALELPIVLRERGLCWPECPRSWVPKLKSEEGAGYGKAEAPPPRLRTTLVILKVMIVVPARGTDFELSTGLKI